MPIQSDLRHPSDTDVDEPLEEVDPDGEPGPPLVLAGDAEIIRRVRSACPSWRESAPSQALVSAIAVEHDRESGLRGTCGVDRARRLRGLAQRQDLLVDEPEDTLVAEVSGPDLVPEPAAEFDDTVVVEVGQTPGQTPGRGWVRETDGSVRGWPVLLLALPAFVAIWSGWVGLGELTGFGPVNLLPGLVPGGGWSTVNTAITLPIGVEAYAAFALRVWLSAGMPERARRFARLSAMGSLLLGGLGQVAYHLLNASGYTAAPWEITTAVACLPVAVLGMGAALAHLIRSDITTTPKES